MITCKKDAKHDANKAFQKWAYDELGHIVCFAESPCWGITLFGNVPTIYVAESHADRDILVNRTKLGLFDKDNLPPIGVRFFPSVPVCLVIFKSPNTNEVVACLFNEEVGDHTASCLDIPSQDWKVLKMVCRSLNPLNATA